MQGDRVGVRDNGAVQGRAWGSGYAASGVDDRRAARQWDRSMLDGYWQGERHEGIQQGGDRDGIGDGAWGWFGDCGLHGDGAVRTDRMRGDRVGVGDIFAVQDG